MGSYFLSNIKKDQKQISHGSAIYETQARTTRDKSYTSETAPKTI